MKVFLWLLAMVAGIGLMIWLLPPREIEERLKSQERIEAEAPQRPQSWPVICPVAPPCWKDGKPISGSL
jgi:hypothetical protein